MRKLLSIALCATAVSAFADGSTEVVLGEVGVTEIRSALSNTVVALSYDDLAGGSGTVYSNLVKTTNLSVGDRLIEFRDDKYTGWVLVEKNGVNCWESGAGYYIDSTGKKIELLSPTADTATNAVGMGIWLLRQNPTDDSRNPIPFYVYGKPASSKTVTTVAGKWMLVGNPNQTDRMFTAEGELTKNEDYILMPDEMYKYTYKGPAFGWRSLSDKEKQLTSIPAGTGFWLMTTNSVTIHW